MKPDKFSEIIKNKQTFTAAKNLTASKDEEKFKTKLIKFETKSTVVDEMAKSRIMDAGLHGRLTSPKNAPKRAAVI